MISYCILLAVVMFGCRKSGVEGVDHPHINFLDDYTYNLKDLERGPTEWGGECRGTHQSPIDIRYKDHGVGWGYTKIWLNNMYRQSQKGFYFTNVGHTFQVQLSGSLRNPHSDLSLSGAGLQHRYVFSQMHFHWGDRDEVGSEHTLQGRRYPMEIHLVHYKTKYGNLSQALSQNATDSNAIMVLSILCQLGSENPALVPIIDAAKLKTVQNSTEKLMFSYKPLNLYKLLPMHLDFVRYMGSLTTPPCTEKVAWTVFLCPISISIEQLETFRRLHDREGKEYYNYRPLQKRNGRTLKYYKVPDSPSTSSSSDQRSRRSGGGGDGSDSASTLITKTLRSALQEVNSLFSNIINLLSEAQLSEREVGESNNQFHQDLINENENSVGVDLHKKKKSH